LTFPTGLPYECNVKAVSLLYNCTIPVRQTVDES